MISAKDTAYPIITDEISTNELVECFTPSQEEIEFCKKATRSYDAFICMIIMLKSFQRYGYPVTIEEVGKKIRTAYLLEYLTDFELRQIVHGATVICEQFNNFTQWIHFAKDYISTVKHDEQVKVIKYNHLIAVILSFWNAWRMTEKIDEVKKEGYVFA